jgi:hypothetical protein
MSTSIYHENLVEMKRRRENERKDSEGRDGKSTEIGQYIQF